MKKTENNKLIAEFMGQPTMIWNDPDPIEGNDYRVVYFKELCDRTALIQYGVGEINSEAEVFLSELEDINLKYHTSWDWLIPVMKKIDSIANEEMDFSDYDDYREKYVFIRDITLCNDILDAYNQVIEFIKWYNENKED